MDDYNGPQRRSADKLLLLVWRQMDELRGELKAGREERIANERRQTEALDKVREELASMRKLVEQGKVIIWMLTAFAGILTWAEAQWNALSRALSAIFTGKP